ncbi:hypothetical protein BKA83DRAFT_4042466 [Pisolithus microcarpus]|nr:hypothetical protein BKA83DRAFT_4042466 [Pisolithus microcarpus]
MSPSRTVVVCWSSDRPNIKIGVQKIKYALSSYTDLAFLIPAGFKVDDLPLPKFLIFFDNIPDSISAACALCHCLPCELTNKIKWFNSEMSTSFKEAELEKLTSGETWGLCTMTSFGMGMDVLDISLVIQWRVTCKLAALWQCFGQAVRDKQLTGTALLFAEKEYFDDERVAKVARKAKQTTTCKWTAKEAELTNDGTLSSCPHFSPIFILHHKSYFTACKCITFVNRLFSSTHQSMALHFIGWPVGLMRM